jgi:putative DNA methylase
MVAKTAPRKKLIEVSIPLEIINRESAKEKQIKVGKPASLHNYWAPRPLAACRAVLFAQLVDDPSACLAEFPTKAAQDAERDRLHKLIAALVPWESSNNEVILNEARYEIARSAARARGDKLPSIAQMNPQKIIDYLQQNVLPIYDPFCGGGSIPLEAQRLGLRAMGSDLNPVAVLISKALVEFPPKFAGHKPVNAEVNELRQWRGAQGLADDVRYYGRWMREQAEKKIGHLYPKVKLKDGKDATVIAWLWARTVPSPDPRAVGVHVPLASSFLLSAKEGKEAIIKPIVDRAKMNWSFEVDERPTTHDIEAAKKGTVDRKGGVCLLTGTPIPFAYIRDHAKKHGLPPKLMAVVVEGSRGRKYLSPIPEHEHIPALNPSEDVSAIQQPISHWPGRTNVVEYGLDSFEKLFTGRQLVSLATFSDLVIEVRQKVLTDATAHWTGDHLHDLRGLAEGGLGPAAYADLIATYAAFCVDRSAQTNSTVCRWASNIQKLQPGFDRQAVPMVWDFGEANIFGASTGSWSNTIKHVSNALEVWGSSIGGAQIFQADAAAPFSSEETIISTDPPYYDNIGYADLADFYYVWLRRSLNEQYPEIFRRLQTPQSQELIAKSYRDNRKPSSVEENLCAALSPAERAEVFFLEGMKLALRNIVRTSDNAPSCIYYAFKQAEVSADGILSKGWASFLQAVVDTGLSVYATWPIRSEHSSRSITLNSNALASWIVLVCRRRDSSASSITRADFLRALRREMPAALGEIRRAGVGPTDIQQAAIGPGIGMFTRHAQVLNTDGTPMLVKDALKLINQVREEITAPATGEYDPETLFALDWFAAKGFEKGRSGDAIVMTNAVDVSLDGINSAGFFLADGGVARLLKREELPDDWDPAEDNRVTVWEACQHLIKRLRAEDGGIDAAAILYNRLGALAEPAHALARRLYDICEQNQWAAEGYVYNQLHQEWDTIEKRAAALGEAGRARDLFSR